MFGAMVFGVGAAIGGFLGGALLETYGGRGIYLTFGSIVLASLALVWALQRRLPKIPSQPATVYINMDVQDEQDKNDSKYRN